MSDLNSEIKAAIEKDLPNQVGKQLITRFKELEEKEAKLAKLEPKNDELQKKYNVVVGEKNALEQRKAEWANLEAGKASLVYDQLKFSVEKQLKEAKVTAAGEKVDLMNNLVGLFMRNPQAVTSVMSNNWGHSTFNGHGEEKKVVDGHSATITTEIIKEG